MAALRKLTPHIAVAGCETEIDERRYELEVRRASEQGWQIFSWPRDLSRPRGRSSSRHWRSTKRRSAPSIPWHSAANLNNLARLLEYQGDLAAARPLFERALAIREKALGPEHPDTAGSLNNLACLL